VKPDLLDEESVRILDYIAPGAVHPGLRAATKDQSLDLLCELAQSGGAVADAGSLRKALEHRENIVTTGIGRGIAIPHADLPEITEPRLLLGLFPEGVDFDSLDEEPVTTVFLLLGTPRTPGVHMKILARIARLAKDDELPELCKCADSGEALSLLGRIEERH
jgi:mannitol/fructose-specific phosphotransferase system IIA component (Ntr-type)